MHPSIFGTFKACKEIRRIKTPTVLNAEVPNVAMRGGVFPYAVCTSYDANGNCLSTATSITPTAAAASYIKDVFNKLPEPQAANDPFSLSRRRPHSSTTRKNCIASITPSAIACLRWFAS